MNLFHRQNIVKLFTTINKSHSLITKKNNINNDRDLYKTQILKLKNYLEVFHSSESEKELDLNDIKIFYYLKNICSEFIDERIFNSEELNIKIEMIIKNNKNKQNNLLLTKFLYDDLQLEKNHLLFKLLLMNNFDLIKRENEEDSLLLHSLPYVYYNLKSNDCEILLNENLLFKLQNMISELNNNQNYKGVDSHHAACFMNIFPKLNVNIVDSESYAFHSAKIVEIILSEKTIQANEIININNLMDYLSFFLNFKENDHDFNFKLNLEIKNKFKILLEYYFLNVINENIKIIPMRYDEFYMLYDTFYNDKKFIKLIEYILHIKLETGTCELDTLLNYVNLYLNKLQFDKFILNFLSINLIKHIKTGLTLTDFQERIILFYEVICQHIQTNANLNNIGSVQEFFEEMKSCLYSQLFIDNENNILIEEEPDNPLFTIPEPYNNKKQPLKIFVKPEYKTISISIYNSMYVAHSLVKNTSYFDPAFDNYLRNTIKLNKQLTNII